MIEAEIKSLKIKYRKRSMKIIFFSAKRREIIYGKEGTQIASLKMEVEVELDTNLWYAWHDKNRCQTLINLFTSLPFEHESNNFFKKSRADETFQAFAGHQHKFQSTLSSYKLTLFSGFLRIFLVAAGWQATFGTTTFIIFECCCCDNCAAEAIDVEFDELFVGGNVSVIHESTDRSSRGPSL